ncbi:MAG: aspartate aminotransferase family protein [Planctomycetota bacterium]|jgi:4-aminobutyrate aminotransferase-like enzyme|nr:aspartate aminotransferase family protein [Planctomycetota bacterium]MDP6762912.1 aspartate aminotransferase family protein [Planctomycetota bacterium]MDP6988626.1 aspartate aminotransferase family protein [Planctomycetota bacterium]
MTEQTRQESQAAATRSKHGEFLLPAVANYYDKPIVLDSGEGMTLRDVDGREYLDFFGGILTVSVGHCNPRVTEPLKLQIERLGHVSSLYPTVPTVELAERLARLSPGRLQKSFFSASGTEADETAVVLAQVFTGAQELIALRHGYSGRSLLAQSLTAHAPWRAVPTQIAGIKHAVSPYCYRCPLGATYPECEVRCATDLRELIQTTTTGSVAGFLAEPIQGVGGFITPPPEYFQIAVDIVREHGGVFICDEVQTGFGRTGSRMFGIEHWGVEPDIMTMAKGVANGMPLGVTIATPEIADAFQSMTISTYGGNPPSCAAALATLDVIEGDDLAANAEVQGARLREGLEDLQRRHPRKIGDVRGKGLMQALELVADETAGDRTPDAAATARLFEETKERGLLIGKGGLFGNVTRISPPLVASAADVDEALRVLGEAFDVIDPQAQ